MIKVKQKLGDQIVVERCCFCRRITSFWFLNNNVACCAFCATFANPEDVPSKKVWCRREDIAGRGSSSY